ncbi:hypothetical protein EFP47_09030 [Lactiplantibacillus pentosus]|nr:hypothetical protein [Lactiplantibacillus pentosus]
MFRTEKGLISLKKWLVGIVIAIVALVAGVYLWSAQNGRQQHSASRANTASSKSTTESSKQHKMLVVYYSNSGTTESAAKTIQKKTGADIIKLRMSPDYPSDYSKLTVVAKRQIDRNQHPKILNNIDFSKYSTVFLGFPTWYHRPPMFINTFFEKYDLKGKTVVPFTTSMSSSIAVSRPYLKKMTANKQIVLQTGFRANETSTITKYLKQHNFTK